MTETRKLLRLRHCGVDGKAARRQSVLVVGAGTSEIGSTDGCEPIGFQIISHDAEAREPGAAGEALQRGMTRGNFEQILVVDKLSRLSASSTRLMRTGSCAYLFR